MSMYSGMFHGFFIYVWTSALKSRFLYAYIIFTLAGVAMVYAATSFGAQIELKISEEAYSVSMRSMISNFCSVLIFLSVFSASRIFPRMVDPGMVGFFFSRPYSRSAALVMTTIAIGLTYSVIIIMCCSALILSYMLWTPVDFNIAPLLIQLGLELTIFLIFTPILVCFAVLSRSGSYAFLGSFTVWIVAYLLAGRRGIVEFLGDDLTEIIADTVYYILPKSSEISTLFSNNGTTDLLPLWSSILFAGALYMFADWKLKRIDF